MKHKILIFAFVIAVLMAFIISFGNSEDTGHSLPTKIYGQVFLNGNPLNEGITKIYVNNVFDSDAQIKEGAYFSPVSVYNQSEVVLKIYANNTLLKEERLFISPGSEEEHNIYISAVAPTSNNLSDSQNSGASNNRTSQGTNTAQSTGTNTTTEDNTITGNNNAAGNNPNVIDDNTDTSNNTTSNQSSQPPTPSHILNQQTSDQNSSNQFNNQTGVNQDNTTQVNTSLLQDNEAKRTTTNPPHTDSMPLSIIVSIIVIFILLLVLIFLIVKRKS